jgi:V/A-type H+-transporting ATPase subunit F
MRYFVIGDEDAVLGFGLVGVRGQAAATPEEAQRAFGLALEDKEVGILIITERAAELIRPQVDRYMFTQNFPLIVEVPDRLGPVAGRAGIREMVNQAIGIKL